MVDQPTAAPGTLFIDTTTPSKIVNIALNVPRQTIYVRGYRIEFDSAANALATRVVYLDIPILNGNKVLDSNVGHVYFPLMLDNAAVTLRDSLNLPIFMSQDLNSTFPIRVLGPDFQEVSNFVSFSLIFETTFGHLN